jgi:RNA polymerase sigma factor (sigma-70 family)
MSDSLSKIWSDVVIGNARAWEILVRRYNGLIVAVARGHGLAAADLEDCAQQTWIALYRSRHTIENPLAVPAWLVRVAKRKAQRIQTRRKTARSAEEQFDHPDHVDTPERAYLAALDTARLHGAIESLDPRCARLLRQLFFADEDVSYKDIARQLGLAPNSLGPIRSRCLSRLRKILEELDDDLY